MNIGFEAKRFFTNNTGLGNYSRFVVRALSNHFPDDQYYLYTPRDPLHNDTLDILKKPNISVITPGNWYKFFRTTSLWRTWGISKESSMQDLHVFHGLSQELPVDLPKKIKKIVTVHDLIFYRFPQFYNPIDIAIYKKKLKFACDKADKIIAISEQTKADLLEFLKIAESRIEIIYQGSHPNFKRKLSFSEIETVRNKYKLPSDYILNVGTIEKRKNLLVLIKALSLLPKEARIPLVILGRPTKYFKEVLAVAKQLNVLDTIFFPQNVHFNEFPAIYQKAKLFIYPSLFEGFGIPLIEAIESGVPVITSIGSCFTEAAGPSSIFVDPHNEEVLAFEINKVLLDPTLARSMVSGSYNYIQRFEPAVIGKKIMDVYKQ
ncbi:MAG: glycosyltransferase family 1 protein [Cyclobacteriaceae bacterium]